jgi:hypothetical protein
VRQDVEYFNLRTPENNPDWRTKWFYAKDKPSTGQEFGLEEMKITQPLMEKIQQLRATPEK